MNQEEEFLAEVLEENPAQENPAFIPPELPDAHLAHGTAPQSLKL
jgi:hypothetical protein